MLGMTRRTIMLVCVLSSALSWAAEQQTAPELSFDYEVARTHEIAPHRRTMRFQGVHPGFNQLRLSLVVSPAGDVVTAEAGGDPPTLSYWPQVKPEVMQWKFTPFEVDGKPVTAEVEEYVDLVPPERIPKVRVSSPQLKPDSKVNITLSRSGCFGSCPGYEVQVTTEGIIFEGSGFVVAGGVHKDAVDPAQVRQLARKFIEADFYSIKSNGTSRKSFFT